MQNWEARTGWNVYQQWQYYTYYPTEAPAPMYARVRVCDSTEDTLRDDLCVRYPNGKYKPIGEIQRYAKGVRVAAFGYLKDDADSAYGGVLRAPMKYPGPSYTDPKGVPQTNDQTEWDSDTGIFTVDPMNAAAGAPSYAMSGVINYLNKFGTAGRRSRATTRLTTRWANSITRRCATSRACRRRSRPSPRTTATPPGGRLPGVHQRADHRYHRHRTRPRMAGPTRLQNACERRNFILAIGDVNTHVDKQLPGHMSPNGVNNTANGDPARAAVPLPGSAGDTFNAVDWTKVLAGFETNTAVAYIDARGTVPDHAGQPQSLRQQQQPVDQVHAAPLARATTGPARPTGPTPSRSARTRTRTARA